MVHRGATEEEVVAAIRQAEWQPAELGRFDCRKGSLRPRLERSALPVEAGPACLRGWTGGDCSRDCLRVLCAV